MSLELIQQRVKESVQVKNSFSPELFAKIAKTAELMTAVLKKGGTIFWAGNGGSAADAQHLAAELVGRFYKERAALPSVALHANTSTMTALANDYSYEKVYSRQMEAFAKPGDVLIGISTSGKSPNILEAFRVAKAREVHTIALTGQAGIPDAKLADITLNVPSSDTPRIQESHILIGHILCEIVERAFV